MATEAILHQILEELKEVKISLREIDEDLHREVQPTYLEKLKRINQQEGKKFKSKEELLQHLKHGI